MLEQKLNEECVARSTSRFGRSDDAFVSRRINGLNDKVKHLTDGEYAAAKSDVDRLREELGQPPLPSLQALLEEKTSTYVSSPRATVHTRDTDQLPHFNSTGHL